MSLIASRPLAAPHQYQWQSGFPHAGRNENRQSKSVRKFPDFLLTSHEQGVPQPPSSTSSIESRSRQGIIERDSWGDQHIPRELHNFPLAAQVQMRDRNEDPQSQSVRKFPDFLLTSHEQ